MEGRSGRNLRFVKANPDAGVIVFLMAEAVLAAKARQKTPDGYYNLERMLKWLLAAKRDVLLCGTCMDAPCRYGQPETLERETAVPKAWAEMVDRQEDFIDEALDGQDSTR